MLEIQDKEEVFSIRGFKNAFEEAWGICKSKYVLNFADFSMAVKKFLSS